MKSNGRCGKIAYVFLASLFVPLLLGHEFTQEKPKRSVLARPTSGDNPGKPVMIKGETMQFLARAFDDGSSAIPGSLSPALSFKSVEAVGQGSSNVSMSVDPEAVVNIKAEKAGEATIKFKVESPTGKGLLNDQAEILILEKMDEFPIHFHFMRAFRKPENVSVVTELTDIGDETKRQARIQPMLDSINKYWSQAGLKFTATHGVTGPANDNEQAEIDQAFNSSGQFEPGQVTTSFYSAFNKSGQVNIYIVKAINGEEGSEFERGVSHTDRKAAEKEQKVYIGGTLIKRAYGAFISDKAIKEDTAHELGHLLGLKDQRVIPVAATDAQFVQIQDLDGIDRINHRIENTLNHVFNLMRAPAVPTSPSPSFLHLTDGQARHARSQLGTFKWSP